MTRYIETSEATAVIADYFDLICDTEYRFNESDILRRLNNSAVDAVPVVRCYECKYFTEFEKGFASDWDGSCRYWNTHSTVYSNFCGCGARLDKE